jgi:elongation factor 1-gamma
MSAYKVYTPHHVPHSRKLFVAATLAGLNFEKVFTNYDQSKTPEYLKKNPNGKFPVVETPEGKFVYESNAILRMIARHDPSQKLYGAGSFEQTLVDQWLDWTTGELNAHIWGWIIPYLGHSHGNKETSQEAEKKLKPLLKILDDHFKTNTYLVGNQVTIADINLAAYLFLGFRFMWDENRRKGIVNITRWFETISNQKAFQDEYGRPILAAKTLEFPNLPVQEEKKEDKKAGKTDKKSQDKPKEAEKKKEDKPDAKKKKEDDEEEEEPTEKKDKNPLDLLPPSTFDINAFKFAFVNATDKKPVLEDFIKNFDAAGWSLYFVEYIKAEGEGEKLYLTNNLMNGFIQRLDHFRKYAFGVHGVYGDEPVLEIRGVWMWRGNGIAQEISDLDSYEYHKFTRLDINNESDKKKLNEFWIGLNEDTDVVDGLVARTVKYFK